MLTRGSGRLAQAFGPMEVVSQSPQLSKRPALIWFTQVLVLFLASVFAFFLVAVALTLDQLSKLQVASGSLLATVCTHLVLFVLLVTLFMGLARRRRWAWPGSILLAIGVVGLIFVYRVFPPATPIPILPVVPQPTNGPGLGDLVVSLLLFFYPLRLLFSREVRQFFGVTTEHAHGP